MVLTLAIASAAVYGVADFLGGMATRRAAGLAVVALAQLVGLVMLAGVLPFLPGTALTTDLMLGAVGGLCGGLGMVLFYQGLAVGPMSVVAPLTAVTSAGVPVIVGTAMGERPTVGAFAGIGLALVAIILVSAEPGASWRGVLRGLRSRATVMALAAGCCFASFFVVLGLTSTAAGLWPLASARVASVSVLAVLAILAGARLSRSGGALLLVLGAGALDMAANVLYLVAVRGGMLTLVAVIASLYPVSTVLLARVVLAERLARPQVAGLGIAVAGVALIAS
jgi:drug/metabolite transporter (DMT)-like permease